MRFIYVSMRALTSFQRMLRERFTVAGWVVLGGAGVAAAAGVDTTQTVTYQAFTFLAALLCIALLTSFFLKRITIEGKRNLPRYATAGEPLSYDVTIVNTSARPIAGAVLAERIADPRPSYEQWLAVKEPLERRRNWYDRKMGWFRWQWWIQRRLPRRMGELALPALAPGETRTLKLEMTPRRRGRLSLEGLTLGRADPLGLVKNLTRVPLPGRVTALPKRYRIPQFALPGKRKFQQGGVSLASSIGDSEEFIGLRDYRPGDPLQRIHWKSFARMGKPIVRECQDEFFERHALILDTGRAEGEDEAFEEAVAVAASFVYTIDTRECLLDMLFVAGGVHSYTAGRGQTSADHLLEVLAGVAPTEAGEFAKLAGAVRARLGSMSSALLVLVTWDEERRKLAESLIGAGLDVRAMLVCAGDAKPADAPAWLRLLHPGEIEAGLSRLG
jgi:uncharacterized protein (DUF58 family)